MRDGLFKINPNMVEEQKEIGKGGVEEKFVKAVTKLGWKAYKFVSESNRGVSDRLVITPGQVWFVEIKRATGQLSPLQESFRNKCIGFKLNHFVVYGEEGINKFIERVKNGL